MAHSAETILGTEFNPDVQIVSDLGDENTGSRVCKSHRPVHGFYPYADTWNHMALLGPSLSSPPATVARRAQASDLSNDPQAGATFNTGLDWVGRNHGPRHYDANGFNLKTSNFLYCDGHVETKSVRETLAPRFEWGDRFYSRTPNSDIQHD